MKHAWIMAAALVGVGLVAVACGDDETATPTTATGTGGAGSACFTPSGGYGPFADVCMADAGDTECLTCTRASCCTEAEACTGDTTCSCILECFLEDCDPIGCLDTCTKAHGQSDEVNALIQCVTPNCDVCIPD